MINAEISFYITVPDNISPEDLVEFVKYKLQIHCQMSASIPLKNWDQLSPHLLQIRFIGGKIK